mmetsp:Transcript_118330/g.235702  ORF Transcript_118330/g.235702 Transcript_118330/m.235702 type:complete len:91 (+) Transcript_118330:277-549(+)
MPKKELVHRAQATSTRNGGKSNRDGDNSNTLVHWHSEPRYSVQNHSDSHKRQDAVVAADQQQPLRLKLHGITDATTVDTVAGNLKLPALA